MHPEIDLPLSVPETGPVEAQWLQAALQAPRLTDGPIVERFERAFAEHVGRVHAVAVASGTLGTMLALRGLGIGAGDEVIVAPLGWHQVAHAVPLVGATPVPADIDYWTGCLDPARAARRITSATRAVIAGNVNGHPAAWAGLRTLADAHGLALLEDSTEAIGSRYAGRPTGSFGDAAVFDFSSPSVLDTGEGGMVVTDDAALARELRYLRRRQVEDRGSVSVGARVPMQAAMSELTAALGIAQLRTLDDRLARRREVEHWYHDAMRSFEGIKPPYLGADVDAVNWMLYVVHLGTRFGASARRQMVDDLAAAGIGAAAYCQPLHRQFAYQRPGHGPDALPLANRIGDRMLALPFHGGLTRDEVAFVVERLKDAATNVGAGAAIYL